MKCVADTSGSTSTRQRSFLGNCEIMPANRRFPPPWTVEELDASFIAQDASE
jgi:hypothetical protein